MEPFINCEPSKSIQADFLAGNKIVAGGACSYLFIRIYPAQIQLPLSHLTFILISMHVCKACSLGLTRAGSTLCKF